MSIAHSNSPFINQATFGFLQLIYAFPFSEDQRNSSNLWIHQQFYDWHAFISPKLNHFIFCFWLSDFNKTLTILQKLTWHQKLFLVHHSSGIMTKWLLQIGILVPSKRLLVISLSKNAKYAYSIDEFSIALALVFS